MHTPVNSREHDCAAQPRPSTTLRNVPLDDAQAPPISTARSPASVRLRAGVSSQPCLSTIVRFSISRRAPKIISLPTMSIATGLNAHRSFHERCGATELQSSALRRLRNDCDVKVLLRQPSKRRSLHVFVRAAASVVHSFNFLFVLLLLLTPSVRQPMDPISPT